jgi:NADPH2:quinone reductase
VAELEALGADAVIVAGDGPISEQVKDIVGHGGVRYAIDPVVGQTGHAGAVAVWLTCPPSSLAG